MSPRADRALLAATVAGVALYVVTWFVLGLRAQSYDPTVDAISELFAIGEPGPQRWTLVAVLGVTGTVLLPVGFVLDRALPGRGRLGVLLTVVAALGTVLAAVFPCTAGCPGVGASPTDTMHAVVAGVGYLGLVTAPIAWARRLGDTDERGLARLGLVLGVAATVGFLLRNLAGLDALGGLQQRVFNTLADAWYVVVAVAVLRRTQSTSRSTPDPVSSAQHRTP